MSDVRMTLFELKEKAKWSTDPEEKKAAIKELSTYRESAIPELQELMSITAYEDIRNACAEVIKSLRQAPSSKEEVEETKEETPSTTNDSNSATDVNATAKDQKKEKTEEKGKSTR